MKLSQNNVILRLFLSYGGSNALREGSKVHLQHSSNDLTLPWRKMQTDASVRTMQWSSPCWGAQALPPPASPLISAADREHGFEGGPLCSSAPVLPGPDVHSDLHIRGDARVTAVHSFRGAPAVVAVVIAGHAVGCVHRHGHPAVQVAVGPAGHIAVRRCADVRRQAATTGADL